MEKAMRSTRQLALVALVLVAAGLVLAVQEADAARPDQASAGGFISYSALGERSKINATPAELRPSAIANPYRRGCSKISRCRG